MKKYEEHHKNVLQQDNLNYVYPSGFLVVFPTYMQVHDGNKSCTSCTSDNSQYRDGKKKIDFS